MEVDLKDKTPDIRYLHDMKDVIYDKEWLKTAPNLELYYMYRGLKKKGELRYDITVVPPQMLGEEFVRTKGNRNSKNFPELYIVLEGEAIFLMQKTKGKAIEIVEDVIAVKAKPGDSINISAEYAVVMINPSQKTLKTANWVSEKNENIYEELGAMKGACYFYTKKGWIKNKNYKKVPKLRFEKPRKSIPKNLDFLKG
ncbi:glucose-6-phosphate isomerase [Patescibacteria group bacterium]|nr:glucose-6-phosphate isomerase [Patescibacteria group bacterium]